jgi:alanine racemase
MITITTQSPTLQSAATQPTVYGTPRTWIEISTTAFEHNVSLYKRIVGNNVKVAIVVKSNAYGHGIHEIAQMCQESAAVDWLCTTSLSEALQLRYRAITKPIVVLSLLDEDPSLALEHDIDVVAYNMDILTMLSALAARAQKRVNIHLKVDTGLSRFGFMPEELMQLMPTLLALPWVTIKGICSHFAESDAADQTYTQQQLATFDTLINTLHAQGITIPLCHTSNTAAVTSVTASRYNFVRIGAGAYGLRPSAFTIQQAQKADASFNIVPVMTWKTTLMALRTLPAGKAVGYGKTYTTTTETRVGFLPVGYYEGYDRRLSNKGTVAVLNNGIAYYAPVIGRICMNVIMIDVTQIPHAQIGDEVVLLGNYPKLQAHEIATTIEGFNPREITTRLNPLIKRVLRP